jgi:hypothetical protein
MEDYKFTSYWPILKMLLPKTIRSINYKAKRVNRRKRKLVNAQRRHMVSCTGN